MIHLTFTTDSQGLYTGFAALGHAGYADPGDPDLICAAITALTTGTIGALQDIVSIPLAYQAEEGEIRCQIQAEAQPLARREQADLLLKSLRLACHQIEATYGSQYVTVSHPPEQKEETNP